MKKIFYFLPVVALALLGACGGSDSEPTPNGGENENGGSQTNVEADKQHISEVAKNVSSLFKPEDQKELVDLGIDFSDLYADLDIPAEWESLYNDAPAQSKDKSLLPGNFLKFLVRGVRHGNSSALTRAANNYVYNYKLSQISGIYEPSLASGRWVKRQNSNSLIFRFNDSKGASCELNVTGSGEENKFSEEYDGDTYNVFIPGTVTVRLTRGSNELAKGVVKSTLNNNNVNINTDITVMNLHVQSIAGVTNSQMNANVQFTVSGKQVLEATATANGNNLNNPDVWDEDHMERVFSTGRANGNILNNQLGVNADLTFSESYFNGWDEEWGHWDNIDKATALARVTLAANKVNSAGSINLVYNGSNRAKIMAMPVLLEEGYNNQYWEYYLEPCLKFNDGTTYSLDDFEDVFSSAFDVFDQLADTYEKAFNIK